ncbi:MAG: hypothetical protein KGH65_02880 [Candidatus Micrarchaeota archaeon]|nr:hypothetical protein [Candidatus Micrarchaeota archaeon]
MNFEKRVEKLKLEHKISVREAIDLQNMHLTATQALRKIVQKKQDIINGHSVKISRSPKEEIKALDKEAATHKASLNELLKIVKEARRRVVPNYY